MRKRGWRTTTSAFAILVLWSAAVMAAEIPVPNAGFEEGTADRAVIGWPSLFGRITLGQEVALSSERAYDGRTSARIETVADQNAGLRSAHLPAQPGTHYQATVQVFNASGSAQLYLEFWNDAGERIGTERVGTSARGEWVPLSAQGVAPEGTVSLTLLLYSHAQNEGVSFYDGVRLHSMPSPAAGGPADESTGTFTNLGGQVRRVITTRGTVFTADDGKVYQGILMHGIPAQLLILDVATWDIVRTLDIPGTTANEAILTGRDGNVYIGTLGTGALYRYEPDSGTLELLGRAIPGESHIYDLTEGLDGKLYGGTYPGGKVFEYDTRTGTFRDLGVAVEGEWYARQVAYDEAEDVLYVGTGSHAKLITWDPESGEKSGNLLDEAYGTLINVTDIDIVGETLFTRVGSRMLVLDRRTHEELDALERAGYGVVPVPDGPNVYLYAAGEGSLYVYDTQRRTLLRDRHAGRYHRWTAAAIVDLEQPFFNGPTLVAWMGFHAAALKFNLESGLLVHSDLDVPGQPIEITHIAGGPDGKVYSSGHQGGIGIYDPETGETVALEGMSQAHASSTLGDTMYFGIYPGARVSAYDATAGWGSGNPQEIFGLGDALQDRPFGMLAVEPYGKVFVGTVAQYGEQKGAFAVYDVQTGELDVMRDFVHDQSILSLAYKDGKVYGGTSIWASYGAPPPTQTEGKLFVWDIEKEEKVLEFAPVPGRRGVTALLAGPDGNIWGFDEGYLFIFNPESEAVVYAEQIIPVRYANTTWKDAWLVTGRDGNVYGTARGLFFKIDASSKEFTLLDAERRFSHLAHDVYGNLYMRSGIAGHHHELWTYRHPDLVAADAIGGSYVGPSTGPTPPNSHRTE